MTARYLGMNRSDGLTVTDLEHISQSIGDILRTPVGSRVMRRDYGSPLASVLVHPHRKNGRRPRRLSCRLRSPVTWRC